MPDTGKRPASDPPPLGSSMLTVLAPEELAGLTHNLGDDSVLVGRDPDCDFVVPSELVSKSHALISPIRRTERGPDSSGTAGPDDLEDAMIDETEATDSDALDGVEPTAYEVSDAGSTNGTMVNGLTVDGAVRLRAGDRIVIGDVELRYDTTDNAPAPTVTPVGRADRRTVLVSYSSTDQPQADRVVEHLQRLGHEVWFDRSNDGSGWAGRLLDVVWSCDLALFLVSPASAGSAKVAREVHLAGAERTPVVALLIERASLSKDLHWYLTQHQPIDLRTDAAAGLSELAEVINSTPKKRIARPMMTLVVAMAIFWTIILVVAAYLALT